MTNYCEKVMFGNAFAPIVLFYRNATICTGNRPFDKKLLDQKYTWHQIVIKHNGLFEYLVDSKKYLLDAIFNAIEPEEFYPIAYRSSKKEDKFLVRNCTPALLKLLERNLCVEVRKGAHVNLVLQLNIGTYDPNTHISPPSLLHKALNDLAKKIIDADENINLSYFSNHKLFEYIIVNLGNTGVFARTCQYLFADNDFSRINGLILRGNNIRSVQPLQKFENKEFNVLDLSENFISSTARFCRDMQKIKVVSLYLRDNPIVKSPKYPHCLQTLEKNIKFVDDVPLDKLAAEYNPLGYDMDIECDGFRITMKTIQDLNMFKASKKWHAIVVPDALKELNKTSLFDYFFLSINPNLGKFFPCYYKYTDDKHEFIVRDCFDQMKYLGENCNFTLKVPQIINDSNNTHSMDIECERYMPFYFRMDIGPFQAGQVEPESCIELGIQKRFQAMNRILNLDNFQKTPGLESIVINLSAPSVLGHILNLIAIKYASNCCDIRLRLNNIISIPNCPPLKLLTNLRSIDLSNNCIQSLNDIKGLAIIPLTQLNLDGNPLCAKYKTAIDYVRAVFDIFKHLTLLDGKNVNTIQSVFNTKKTYFCNLNAYELVDQFVKTYFDMFAGLKRYNLRQFYNEQSIFTMSCNIKRRQVMYKKEDYERIGQYTCHSRNLYDLQNPLTQIYIGADEVMGILMQLPKILFDFYTFKIDVPHFDLEKGFTAIYVSGVFKDQMFGSLCDDMLFGFSQQFILKRVKQNIGLFGGTTAHKIINHQLSILECTKSQKYNAFKILKLEIEPKAIKDDFDTKEKLIIIFHEITKLSMPWTNKCLNTGQWNLKDALLAYKDFVKANKIPDSAYVNANDGQ